MAYVFSALCLGVSLTRVTCVSSRSDGLGSMVDSALSSGSVVDVDQGIEKLRGGAASLKPNATASYLFSRLPPEMLSRIFYFLSASPSFMQTASSQPVNLSSPWPWQCVTHVCGLWRDVALSCPTLWTCVDMENACGPKQLCKRSKGAPIIIQGNIVFRASLSMPPLYMKCLRSFPQKRTIGSRASGMLSHSLEEQLYETAPLLESLSLVLLLRELQRGIPTFTTFQTSCSVGTRLVSKKLVCACVRSNHRLLSFLGCSIYS